VRYSGTQCGPEAAAVPAWGPHKGSASLLDMRRAPPNQRMSDSGGLISMFQHRHDTSTESETIAGLQASVLCGV
jgi:hypothetical protein